MIGGLDALLESLVVPNANRERTLAALLEDEARPIVRAIVRRELTGRGRADLPVEDVEDVEASVLTQVLTRLRDLTNGVDAEPIRDFRAYVAVAAFHGCHHYIRQRRPERARLKNRLRYLLSHDNRFATWESAGRRLCGLRAWQGRATAPGAATRLQDEAPSIARAPGGTTVPEVAAALAAFEAAGGPVELDDLTSAAATILGIIDRPPAADEQGDQLERLSDPSPSVETSLSDLQSVRLLWEEVRQLPVRQRVALLLNLRDPQGGGALLLLPATGIAGIRAIADTLEMPAAELASIWGSLPQDDARIAERLGITRQQVINLRKSARDRLARRVRALDPQGAGNMAGASRSSQR